jgi:hypothetical protein
MIKFLIQFFILLSFAALLNVIIGMIAKYVYRKINSFYPLTDLLNIVTMGLARIVTAGVILIVLGIPSNTVFTSILILLILIVFILYITGLAENILTGITCVRQANIKVGMHIRIFRPNSVLDLKITKLDLLYLHGKSSSGELNLIPYYNLQQGFTIMSENN